MTSRRTLPFVIAIPLAAGLFATGCTVGPAYRSPDLSSTTTRPYVSAGLDTNTARISGQAGAVAAWWHQLGDEELIRLINDLVRQNLTLIEAQQRVVAARAVRRAVGADRLPRVDATADVATAGTGKEAVNFRGPPPGQDTEVYSTGLSAAWELDLWGRVERLTRAADAEIDIAIEDYRDAAVSIAAELAEAYIDLRISHARIAVLDRNIALQRQLLALAEDQLKAGTGTELDVAQTRRQFSQTEALRPPLLEAATRSENRIAILLGRRPGDVVVKPGDAPQMPRMIGIGLPADLIAQRADVRRAIAAYRSAVERSEAIKAEHYPTVTLSGTLNLQSSDAGKLLSGDAYTYNLGPSLRLPLFEGGRIDARTREQIARAAERRAAAERTLLKAIEEVENAAVGVVRSEERRQRLAEAIISAKRTVDLSENLYRTGLSSLLQVIDAQRELVAVEDQSLVARRDALAQTVRLYRALGGGWNNLNLPEPAPTDPTKPVQLSGKKDIAP